MSTICKLLLAIAPRSSGDEKAAIRTRGPVGGSLQELRHYVNAGLANYLNAPASSVGNYLNADTKACSHERSPFLKSCLHTFGDLGRRNVKDICHTLFIMIRNVCVRQIVVTPMSRTEALARSVVEREPSPTAGVPGEASRRQRATAEDRPDGIVVDGFVIRKSNFIQLVELSLACT